MRDDHLVYVGRLSTTILVMGDDRDFPHVRTCPNPQGGTHSTTWSVNEKNDKVRVKTGLRGDQGAVEIFVDGVWGVSSNKHERTSNHLSRGKNLGITTGPHTRTKIDDTP